MTLPATSHFTAECEACGIGFNHPNTGPRRRFCLDPECRRRRHARAGWASYQKRLEAGIDDRLPASHIAAVKAGSDFSERFRNADPVALFYEVILARDPCSYCSGRERMTPDHITAWTKGGTGDCENLTASCYACNSSKGDRPLLLWLLESPRLNTLRLLDAQLAFPL